MSTASFLILKLEKIRRWVFVFVENMPPDLSFVYSMTQGLGKMLNLVSRVHIPHFPFDTYVYICTLYL